MEVGKELLSVRMLLKSTLSNFPLLLSAFCSLLSNTIGRPLTIKRCGLVDIPKSRIVGGHRAQDGAYPWMVSLHEKNELGFDHFCGGAILNEHWIVTAAHCIEFPTKARKYTAYAGVHKLSKKDRWQSREIKISKIIIHEDYDPDTYVHDIALLRTRAPMDFVVSKGYVNGICLPETKEDPEGWAIVTGWGHTEYGGGKNSDELRTVKIPIVPREICNTAYDEDEDDDITENVLDTQICAGATKKDSCQNDSGGPLIQRDRSGVHTLIGIVSYGIGCGEPDMPGVYTKVASYRDWLEEKIQD